MLRNSVRPISAERSPRAACSAIWRSVSLSSPVAGDAGPEPGQFDPGPARETFGPQLLERRQRGLELAPGECALLEPAMDLPLGEQAAGPVQAPLHPVVELQRTGRGGDRGLGIALFGAQQRLRARRGRQRRGPLEPRCRLDQCGERALRVGQPAGADERLDVVAGELAQRRLGRVARLEQLDVAVQVGRGRLDVAGGERAPTAQAAAALLGQRVAGGQSAVDVALRRPRGPCRVRRGRRPARPARRPSCRDRSDCRPVSAIARHSSISSSATSHRPARTSSRARVATT